MAKIKLAVIGAGYWGKNLVRVFNQLGALHSVCDTDKARLDKLSNDYPGIRVTPNFKDILDDKSISAVVIAAPAESHYLLAKEFLSAGKDIFVEKPLAITSNEGEDLVKLAKRHNKILMVGHILEYHPAVVKLKELISRGELGKIQYVYSNRLNLGKIRKEENILWSFAPHDISAMLFMLNEVPETVSAAGGNYIHHNVADVTVSNLVFSSGIKGHIFVSWLHPYKEQRLVIVGDKKMALFNDLSDKDKLVLFNHKIEWINRFPVPKRADGQTVKLENSEPLRLECLHFLKCLKDRSKPRTSGESALKVLKVLQACQISLENGGIPLSLESISDGDKKGCYIHPSSIIDQPCSIGKGTKVWHYSHIMKGAKIGKNCNLGQNVLIASKAVICDNVKIQNNVSIYEGVTLENDVFCGPSVVFTNVINPRSCVNRKNEYRKTLIKQGASLGANSTIVCGHIIGEYAFVGAGAVVTKDIPDYALVYGNPARLQGWMCQCGIKLNTSGKNIKCASCSKEYALSKGKLKIKP